MTAADQERNRQANALYERHGKPLETGHWGKYVAISPEGETVLGETVIEAVDKALQTFGPGGFLFKVGEKAVWRWR